MSIVVLQRTLFYLDCRRSILIDVGDELSYYPKNPLAGVSCQVGVFQSKQTGQTAEIQGDPLLGHHIKRVRSCC